MRKSCFCYYYTTESYRQLTFTIGKNHVIIAHKSRKNKNSAQIFANTKTSPFNILDSNLTN